MTIISSLLVFLLCLSMHACNARSLGQAISKLENEKRVVHISSKEDNEMGSLTKISSVPPKFKSSMSTELTPATNGDNAYEGSHQAIDTTSKPKDLNDTIWKLLKDRRGGKKSVDAVQKKSPGSVSWRVPHKKRGEHQPGFNLDYSPPKTHPPHHN